MSSLRVSTPWFEETGDSHVHQVLITAGRTLALRFNPKGRYLRSFVAPESLFIDIMMNVPIIFYAANETGNRDLARVATAHCLTGEACSFMPRPAGRSGWLSTPTIMTAAFPNPGAPRARPGGMILPAGLTDG